MVTHVILTRFNIPTLGREGTIRASADWLKNRFELFETFCLPSVKAQTNGDFTWYVYFDAETPSPYKERAAAYADTMPQLRVRFGDLDDFSLARIQEDVVRSAAPGDDWVITTRLDNDDALARDFVERVRNAATPGVMQVLNVTQGVIWSGGRVYRHEHLSNAFASLSESLADCSTIFIAPHMELSRVAPIKQVAGDPGWMQVIHGQNVSNRVRGRRISPGAIRRQFALSDGVPLHEISPAEQAAETAIFQPMRALRDTAIAAAKRLMKR